MSSGKYLYTLKTNDVNIEFTSSKEYNIGDTLEFIKK
jgi:hypothetical protein